MEVIKADSDKDKKPCFFRYISPQEEERKKLQQLTQKPPMSAPTGETSVKSHREAIAK